MSCPDYRLQVCDDNNDDELLDAQAADAETRGWVAGYTNGTNHGLREWL